MELRMSVKSSLGLSVKDNNYDLPLEFRIPIKQRAVKPLSDILPYILTAVKTGLQKYHDICLTRSGVNQMWILKSSKYLLETLSSRSQCLTALTHLIHLPQFLIRYSNLELKKNDPVLLLKEERRIKVSVSRYL
jgi:hypothetical protein